MTPTKILVSSIIILLCFVYLQSYLAVKEDYTILQTWLEKVSPDTLADKHPIVIFDQVARPEQLLTTLFAYMYVSIVKSKHDKKHIMRNRAKYAILFSERATQVHLISPKYKKIIKYNAGLADQDPSVKYVTIKLKPHQLVILPMSWMFTCDDCEAIYIYDSISYVLRGVL